MTVKIFKNFLTKEECEVLNSVAYQGIEEGWINKGLQDLKPNYSLRYTSRFYMNGKQYPESVITIANKINSFCNVDTYPPITQYGNNGVVVSVTFKGGSVYKHKDPRSIDNLPTYRCNVLTQANEDGCDLYVDGKKIDIEVGDLHCYMVSEIPHYVTEAKGDTPRIMWMFGAHIPVEEYHKFNLTKS